MEKFFGNAALVLLKSVAEQAVEIVKRLERIEDIGELMRLPSAIH